MIDPASTQTATPITKTAMDTVLQVLSWVLNTTGVAVGIASLLYAHSQSKKTKTAEALVKKVKMDLYHQKASQVFGQMSTASSSLTTSIRAKDWPKAMDNVISLGGQIANALGAFPELVGSDGISSLRSCAADLAGMFDSLPIAHDEDCDNEVVKSLVVASVNVDFRLQTIAGKMRLAIELEKPDERNIDSSAVTVAGPSVSGGQAHVTDFVQDIGE